MTDRPVTRRRFAGMITTAGAIGIAGCADDLEPEPEPQPDDDDDPEPEPEPQPDADDEPEPEPEPQPDDDDDPEPDGDALVRVAHASPDAPNVDVYVGEDPILEDVPFRTVSEYLSVPEDTYQVEITAAGDPETVVFDEEVSIEAETSATVAAIGELEAETFEVRAYDDDTSPVAEGDARVKVVHASPDAPEVDVVVAESDEILFSDLAFGEASETATVPSDSYTLDVRPAGEQDTVASFDVDLEAETAYTAFAMGYLNPDDAAVDEPFDLTVAMDSQPE